MSINSEQYTSEPLAPGFEQPAFLIDPDAPEDLARQLQIDELWLKNRPSTRILALRQFVSGEAVIKDDSVWQRLTGKEAATYLGFDAATEAAVKADSEYRHLQDLRKQNTSRDAADGLALKVRLRRIEIFLERTKVARGLGRLSISKEA